MAKSNTYSEKAPDDAPVRKKGKAITDEDLKALLSSEIRSSVTYEAQELSDKRAKALEYMRGEMRDTPSMPGRSQVISRDVADVIGWMLPGIIRVFTASDRMAEYEPVAPGDEDFSQQATDYGAHVFWKDNPGYRILWDATHDSLLLGNGIVKHWWDDKEECDYSEHSGLTAEQIAILEQEKEVEIVSQKPGEPQMVEQVDPATGQPMMMEVETFDIKVKRVTMNGKLKLECIEPENFLMDKNARFIEEARFCAHRDEVSRSDLIEMGFSKSLVDNLPADKGSAFSEETLAREEEYDALRDVGHESTRLIELYECYVKADTDGDGISETIRAYYAGAAGAGELLDWDVWEDDVPFSDIPCEPVPHRWDARSVFDEVVDIQRINTVLTRQMLDNFYASNVPMREAVQGSVINPEMLTAPKFGGVIWRKQGSEPTIPHTTPLVADKALVAIQHFNDVREMRTGISRSSMALDPEALQNQTATANQNQKDAAYSQVELIARNQAELGWRRVFRQILKLIVKHQDRPRTIRLRDKWVEMDPRAWNANMDVTINVGLGTGSRDRDMSMLNNILGTQVMLTDRLSAGGFGQLSVEMLPRIRNTLIKLAESAGLKNPETYYPEVPQQVLDGMKQQISERQQAGDPKIEAEKAKAVLDAQANEAQAQRDHEYRMAQANAKLEVDKIVADYQHIQKVQQINGELDLKARQLTAELDLKERLGRAELEVDRELGHEANANKAAEKTSGVHMGGSPG